MKMNRIKGLFAIKGYFIFIATMILMGISMSITFPFLSLYFTQELGVSAGAFGIFMAISSVGGIIVNSAVAKKSDSGLDRKWIIVVALLGSAMNYFVYLFFHQFFILLIVVTLFAAIAAPAFPQIFAYAQSSANASGSDDIIFAMSTLRSLFSLGFLVGPLIGTIILNQFNYNGLFFSTALILVAISLLVMTFLESGKNIPKTAVNIAHNEHSYTSRDKIILFPLLAFIILFAINSINGINTPLFVVNDLGGSQTDVGLIASVCAGIEIPIMIALGALGKRISNLTLMISSCFIGIIYFLLLYFSSDPWQVIGLQVFQAVFVAIVMGNGLSYFAEILPHDPGVASTYYANGQIIGRLVGTAGGGIVAQAIGFRTSNILWIMFLILAFIALWLAKKESSQINQ